MSAFTSEPRGGKKKAEVVLIPVWLHEACKLANIQDETASWSRAKDIVLAGIIAAAEEAKGLDFTQDTEMHLRTFMAEKPTASLKTAVNYAFDQVNGDKKRKRDDH